MRLRLRQIIGFAILALVVSGCIKRPKGVLSDKQMAPVVADMELAEAYIDGLSSTKARTSRDEVVEYVIQKHGLTREQFDSTMSWYGRNQDAYFEMCELAEKQLQKRKKKISGTKSVEIETTDLWPYQRQLFMSPIAGVQSFDFDIPTADVTSGSRLNLIFHINNSINGIMLLGAEYDNGATTYMSRNLHDAKRVDLTLQIDTARAVTRIFGNLMLNDMKKLPVWLDSIYLKSLPYDSVEYYKIRSQRFAN